MAVLDLKSHQARGERLCVKFAQKLIKSKCSDSLLCTSGFTNVIEIN